MRDKWTFRLIMFANMAFALSVSVLIGFAVFWVMLHPTEIGHWFHQLTTAAQGDKQ